MPQLFKFTPDLPVQLQAKSFGKKTVDQFRLTSSFDISAKLPAYAMLSGTILLQQQLAPNDHKVNLFLKPSNLKDLKLPVKYVIYRGLDIMDFLTSSNITDAATTVKVSGSELLDKMQLIQQNRAPGDSIPVEALFGSDLSPIATKNIDEFFFKNLAPLSQLFTIEGGIKLGEYAVGEIGIEIMLENPEYFPTVEMAKKTFHEQLIVPADLSNPKLVKWKKDLVRHFVDPAAFYGLHHSITEGIGYRFGVTFTEAIATTKADIVSFVLAPFFTKNVVYLDIRNENGYSYNYYGNYDGTGTNAAKEIKIGPTTGGLIQEEYYADGWAIRTVSGIAPSTSQQENTFFFRLRIKDNERPLIAGNSDQLPFATGPNADQTIKFIDESILLPSPIPSTLPEFTEPIQVAVPNNLVGSTGEQIACLVQLDYHKQIRLNDGTDLFPYNSPTDHLFGPITAQLPWDSTDAVQWSGTHNFKYYDGLHQGFVYGTLTEPITALDPVAKTIKINTNIASQVSNKVFIKNSTHPENVGEYHVVNAQVTGATETTITVLETFPSVLQTGDELTFNIVEQVIIDYPKKTIIVSGVDVTGVSVFTVGKTVWLYTKIGDIPLKYTISSSSYIGSNTLIVVSTEIVKEGFGVVMETGFVIETDTVPGANIGDNVIHYAVPKSYYKNTGIKDTNSFSNIGGTNNKKSFLNVLKERIPNFNIEKFNLDIGVPTAILGYPENTASKENLLILGISRVEFDQLLSAANALLSPLHTKMMKLTPQGNRLRDSSYQSYYKYKVAIAGLDSSGIYSVTTPNVTVYSRDNMIFTSEAFALGDALNAIQLTQEEKFHLNPQSSFGEYNKKQNFLDNNSTFAYLYETKGAALKTIVDSFKANIDALTATNFNTSIQAIILASGKNLLDTARNGIKTVSDPLYNKDGALYLARLQMRKALKEQPLVANSFISLSKLEELLDLIEEITRGLHTTNKPDFSSNTEIPILISGFDPFKAIYDNNPGIKKEGLDIDYHLSNSSGNIALGLNDVVLTHIGTGKSGIIKGPVFPVRYREFDDGWIEHFFEPYINPAHPDYQEVKMIITFSYGIESTVYNFEMERFAARKRGDSSSDDNNLKRAGISSYLNLSDKDNHEFIETSLPTDKLFILNQVGLDQKATLHYYNNETQLFNGLNPKQKDIVNPNGDNDIKDSYKSLVLFPSILNYPESGANKIKSVEGSGGNYMSNEIFYRVAVLREKYNPTLKTGHIHVGYLRNFDYSAGTEITVDINKSNMMSKIKDAITQAIEIL